MESANHLSRSVLVLRLYSCAGVCVRGWVMETIFENPLFVVLFIGALVLALIIVVLFGNSNHRNGG
jgi:hypothetical protein